MAKEFGGEHACPACGEFCYCDMGINGEDYCSHWCEDDLDEYDEDIRDVEDLPDSRFF